MTKNLKYLIFAIFALQLSACSDWLTLEPEDGVTREEFWQTKEHVNSAVVGCYMSMQANTVDRMFAWGEFRADMLENGAVIDNSINNIFDGEISPENPIVNWSGFYNVINNCNTVLKFAPQVRNIDGTFTEKQLKEYEAEALTIRAMMYFYLVRAFRDVPMSLEAYYSDDQDLYLPTTPGEVILDTLVHDLRIAIANAPISYSGNEKSKSRITSWAARALLADIFLWQEKYAEANALCDEVIGSNRYSLIPVEKFAVEVGEGGIVVDTVTVANESDADKMFVQTYVNGRSVESIFEIPFTTDFTNPFYSLVGPSINRVRPKIDIMDGTIFPEPAYASAAEATDIRGLGCSFRANLVWKYVGTGRTGDPRAATNYTTPWIMYKYSDILLMKAEAMNQIGLQTSSEAAQNYYKAAINAMNQVRMARNAVKTSDYKFIENDVEGKMLEKAILQERAREFAYEGKRWFDVLRYAKRNNYGDNNIQYLITLAINSATPEKLGSLMAKYRDPKHNSHYWPIYIHEIETNKNLTQNEFYAK